ncbi:MAG: single-stranded-DNA-specific exonuclease RecJ [Bacteroidales bacterium]|nr:single-stranded-DNA-specific exonuclease RecJ [Bacteroidales bacterium]
MDRHWIVNSDIDPAAVERISEDLQISKSLARLLVHRHIRTTEEAKDFFRPNLEKLHDPFLMKDMDKAVQRIMQACEKKEKVLIFGDYDVDGTSAVALTYSFLKRFGLPMEYYVPDRYNEGYGISTQAVEYAHEQHFTLMIVLDCGIKCHEEIALANSYGIDTIVCDHHLADETLPDAYAVLDPKRKDCAYPFKELSGCGVGFKLIQAIAKHADIPEKEVFAFLDLVVISIASDIVPITGENRILAYWGLQLINKRPRAGITSILSYSHIVRNPNPTRGKQGTVFNQLIKINDLVFNVGPRINAAGRMDTGRNSVHLLISEKAEKITELGERINEHNRERKELDYKITQEAIHIIDNDAAYEKRRSIAVYHPDWSKGVIGIVASRLVERYYKPTIVMSLSNEVITGSARSVRGFDLYAALCQCSHLLEHFGGHTYAAGLSLKPENLQAFIDTFEQAVSSSIQETSLFPTIDIDEELSLDEITNSFYEVLNAFEPFGPENMSPVFITRNVVADTCHIVGKNHLKMTLYQRETRSYSIPAIAFDMGRHYSLIAQGRPFHICYHIERNEWRGRTNLQLTIKDIKFDFAPFDKI